MLGVTMISGVRGSPFGGSPGRLNIWPIAGPEKICPMPAMLLVVGDLLSSIPTAFVVCVESESQISEMSSSVGPIPSGFAGDSESGSRASRIVAGEVVMGLLDGTPIPRYRAESTGLWPCLAEMITRVDR